MSNHEESPKLLLLGYSVILMLAASLAFNYYFHQSNKTMEARIKSQQKQIEHLRVKMIWHTKK